MAFTLIGGAAVGTVLVLAFLPALYALWFRIRPAVKAPHLSAGTRLVSIAADEKCGRLPVLSAANPSTAD